ncbi:MAG: glutathione S-transferase family protein, partial [Mesorhizobium sp.]
NEHAATLTGVPVKQIKVAEGRELLARFADISDWYARFADRASFARTEQAG